MQSNHRVHTTSKNLEIPKGITILNWGRLYHNKPKMHTFHTNKPKLHICKYQNTNPCGIPQYKQWSILMSYTFVPYMTTINQGIIYMFSNHTYQYICIMQLNIQSLSTIGYYNWDTYATYIIRYMFENNWVSNRPYNRLKRLVKIYV